MNIRRTIRERLRTRLEDVDVESDVHAAIAANVGESGTVTAVSTTPDTDSESAAKTEETEQP